MKKLPDLRTVKCWVQDFRRDVIRMMRLRFILTAMAILIVVFIIMLTSINMIMKTVSASQSMRLLEQIAESERYNSLDADQEKPPEKPSERPTEPPSMPAEQSDASAQSMAMYQYQDAGVVSLAWGEWDANWQDWWQVPQDNVQENIGAGGNPGDGGGNDDGNNDGNNGGNGGENWGWGWGWQPPQDGQNPWENPQQWWWQQPQESSQDDGGRGRDDDHREPPDDRRNPSDQPPPPPTEATEKPTQPAVVQDVTEAPKPRITEAPTEPTTEPETVQDTTERPKPPPTDTPVPPEQREPRPDRWNVSITIDHFAIMADAEGNFLGLRNTEDYTEDEAKEILAGILSGGKDKGMYGWLQYCRAEKSYGTLLVITDKTSDQGLLNNLFRLTVIVGILMLLVLLVILIFLSKMITDPVQLAFTRQKQFVSDAGHELKTPIAVLTANADILQDEIGENKWLGYMQEQIGRMNQLVGDLLRLARMDSATQEYHFEDFDLSLAVAATALPFESAAFEQNRNLEMDIQPGLTYHGSEQHIRQLCAIFIDNALKYSNENGTIKITLLRRGEHSVLEFYNTGCEISQSETEKIFERFYRGDKARNNKGKNGYGLGLAIAKSIMEVHRIGIQVTCEQGRWIRFLLTL